MVKMMLPFFLHPNILKTMSSSIMGSPEQAAQTVNQGQASTREILDQLSDDVTAQNTGEAASQIAAFAKVFEGQQEREQIVEFFMTQETLPSTVGTQLLFEPDLAEVFEQIVQGAEVPEEERIELTEQEKEELREAAEQMDILDEEIPYQKTTFTLRDLFERGITATDIIEEIDY